MSQEDLRLCQQNEIEVIKAIYVGDVDVEDYSSEDQLEFTVRLLPQRGSSGGGHTPGHNTYIVVHFKIPHEYPRRIPELWIKENKGLSSNEVLELESELKNVAKSSLGEVMIYQLLTTAEAYLYNHQKRPTGSFHDEMLMRRKELEEQSVKKQMQLKERERMVIREEILKKQEELKEEIRKRKEQRKSLPEDLSPPSSLQSSPTKGDGFPSSLKQKTKRKSLSGGRRGRSNSEGSDSSSCDSTELTILEFPCGKSTTQFHRGEVIGRSSRGSTVYAGMSRSGSLVAISEWKFVSKLDKKGREIKSISGGGDSMSLDGLIKQVNSCEAEMNLLQKLEHSNIVLYYGIKVQSPSDEPGVVYVYLAEEFVRGTTLQSYLQDTLALDLSLVRHCAKGMLEGLKFLHDNDVVHRFLRDTSVFLDTNGEIKLTDYGVERKICELYQSFCRLPPVPDKFPPSIGRGGKKGDIYRFGVIILSLIQGQYAQSPPEIPTTFPSELQDFLKKCLTSIENLRWSASELLEHAFIKMPLQRGPTVRFCRQTSTEHDDKNLDDKDSPEDDVELQFLPRFVKGHSRVQSEFEIQKWLGKGGFGDVLKVKNKLDSRIYALKRIRLNPKNKQLNKKITREVKLLSQLNHENVVRYFNSWIETVIESDDEGTSTETPSTDVTTPNPPTKPVVRFKSANPFMQNSLGMLDNVEDLAPPMMNDSEWSVSVANRPLSDESDSSSEDDEDLFGTSFLRLADPDSEAVIFESDSTSGPQEDSSFSTDQKIEELPKTNGENGKESEPLSLSGFLHESQYMYIQMEFCEKSTLKTAIDDNLSEDLDRAWRLFREIVEGLVHIHQQGMIHRDLKPVNIFLDSTDSVKIGDFGLATSSIITKGSDDVHILEKETDGGHGTSIDFPEESRTGQVGTALYVAPELITTGVKICYNQKVDIYSLGIIFFEMFYHPPQTAMERVRVIAGLRKDPMEFPNDFDQQLIPQVTHITKWLLNKEPNKRPTSLELLQSDYLPPPHLEEAELRDIFSRTLNNSQSKAYKYLVASCFKQKLSAVDDITFDMESGKLIQDINCARSLHFVQRVKQVIQHVFEKHGAIEVNTPLLMPKSAFYEDSDTCVNLMCHSGSLVSIPHDLRIPFARYVGRYGISHMKRYSIDKVFRERKVHGLHPRELIECAFDIVDSSQGSLISDGEVLSVMFEIIHELPWLRNKACTIRLGHTKLLQGVLLHCGVNEEHHKQITKILADVKVERDTKSQIQTHLCSLGLPDHFITMLFTLMEVEGSFAKISNLLKGITKRKGEAASCIKEGLHELEILINNIETFGLKCTLAVAPTMTFGSHIYSGLLFQIVCNLKRRKNKMTVDVIAAGGRYDTLIQSFRTALSLESEASVTSRNFTQCGVGISISLDKLIAGFEGEDESDWGNKGSVDAIICCLGHHHMSKEKIDIMKEFLAHGIHSSILGDSQTLETAEEFCKEIGATFLVILKEGEYYSNIRVRIWERGRFNERRMTKQEAIDLISRSLEVGMEGPGSSLYANGITRSESGPVKQIGSSAEANSTSAPTGNSGLPNFNISFVVQEREKLAIWKRRHENQVMSRIQEILPKLAKQQTVEVVGLEVNAAVINTLASCLALHDKDEFSKGVGEAIEKHPRLKKYLNTICDDIYELNFEKNASVIIIYGLIDNSYRVLL